MAGLLVVFSIHAEAQLFGHYTQHMLNKYQFNPAFGGLERSLSVHLSTRSQWTNSTQNPGQQYLSAHLPVYSLNGAVGMQIENESLGLQQHTSAQLSYNYVLKSSVGLFSFGASAGILRIGLNGAGIVTPEGEYNGPIINHNDPELTEQFISGNTVINTLGVYYVGDYLEAGVSMMNFPSRNSGLDPSNLALSPRLTMYIESYFLLGNAGNKVTTSALLMTNESATQLTLSGLGEFGNILAGMSLRGFSSKSLDAINFLIGSQVNKKLRISYSYDYGLSNIQTFSEGSHELQLNYNLNKQIAIGLPPKVIYNPRSL